MECKASRVRGEREEEGEEWWWRKIRRRRLLYTRDSKDEIIKCT